jgi:phosphoribosylaminoimidazole-succinocarboxamide synthase
VRDVYAVDDKLLIVATDRISAFDVVLPSAIPCKGAVLTALSLFWFKFLEDTVSNHLVTADVKLYPPPLSDFYDHLEGRSMLVSRAEVFPIECVARGYLAGSGWKEYRETGEVCGIRLPSGLRESDRLPSLSSLRRRRPRLDTTSISARERWEIALASKRLANSGSWTLAMYSRAVAHAQERGIIIADTKFEFGVRNGKVILVDEALTPDSSRFWPEASYQPGGPQQSFDKQYVRDYLETLDWDKRPPGPALPEAVVTRTSEKYLEAYRLLTGHSIADWGSRIAR